MEQSKILTADILDIVFEGRNKNYGAYELRKTYNQRIRYSIGGMVLICLLCLAGSLLAGGKKKSNSDIVIASLTLEEVKKQDEPKVEPPKEIPQEKPPVEQVKVTPPKIVADELVEEKDEVKDVEKLEEANHIGTMDVKGENTDIVAPPEKVNTGVVDGPLKKETDIDGLFTIVQTEAQFPGGRDSWRKFLERNLNRDVPADNGAPPAKYTVIVSFVVDREGNLSEFAIENDPGFGTKAEVLRVMQKSPKWTPAIQNGRNVKYRQRQAVTFEVSPE